MYSISHLCYLYLLNHFSPLLSTALSPIIAIHTTMTDTSLAPFLPSSFLMLVTKESRLSHSPLPPCSSAATTTTTTPRRKETALLQGALSPLRSSLYHLVPLWSAVPRLAKCQYSTSPQASRQQGKTHAITRSFPFDYTPTVQLKRVEKRHSTQRYKLKQATAPHAPAPAPTQLQLQLHPCKFALSCPPAMILYSICGGPEEQNGYRTNACILSKLLFSLPAKQTSALNPTTRVLARKTHAI